MSDLPSNGAGGKTPRGPGAAYTALSVLLLVALAIFAYSVPQQPPPSIAAFAPQPKQLIKQAPPDQVSPADKGEHGRGNRGAGSSPAPGAPPLEKPKSPIEVPRQRDCIGDLQIDDPQSPPCVPGFIGDNGGATSFGVTGKEIRVSLAKSMIGYNGQRETDDLFAFFNKRFEFYGRKMVLVPFDDSASPEQTTSVDQMISDAITVHDQLKVFASLGYAWGQQGTSYYYYDKLASLGVLSTEYSAREPVTLVDQQHYAKYAPYEWNFAPTIEQVQQADADLICSALARRPARFGGPEVVTQQRKFGMIVQYKSNTDPPKNLILKEAVKRCTGQDLVQVQYADADTSQIPTLLNALRNEGVTTVMCMCYWATLYMDTMPVASNLGYYPEWFTDSFGQNDVDYGCHGVCPPDQASHMYNLRSNNKARLFAETPYVRALKDVDPTFMPSGCGGCSASSTPDSRFSADSHALYENLLTLASGIQMAGPRLTPQTFQDGLLKTRFPNPGCDGPPVYQGCVGFSPSNRSMVHSYELQWWSPNDVSPEYNTPGTWCYVDRGRRFRIGNMPKTDAGIKAAGAPCR